MADAEAGGSAKKRKLPVAASNDKTNKKRRREKVVKTTKKKNKKVQAKGGKNGEGVAKSKKKKTKKKKKDKNNGDKKRKQRFCRPKTISIALPGSIVDNCQTRELQSYVAGQVARAAAIFQIDEVIVFNDSPPTAIKPRWNPNVFLARILQYLETPQYLRKALFTMQKDLKYAGILNPLDTPHHMKREDITPFREGVVVNRPAKSSRSWVNVGLRREALIDYSIPPKTRVTVKMGGCREGSSLADAEPKPYGTRGTPVAFTAPKAEAKLYWGYQTRLATSLSAVWEECPFKAGYDVTIGTSERGDSNVLDENFAIPSCKHLLVVFGGVHGLEVAVDADNKLEVPGKDARCLFDMWVNTCPFQGSGTIRTEEAILISLASLSNFIRRGIKGKS